MKKINKKILIIVIAFVFVVSLTVILINIAQHPRNNEQKIDKIKTETPIILESPRLLFITNGVITWEKVTNAKEYVVCINDLEFTTKENYYNLDSTSFDEAEVSIYSKGYDNYLSSIKSIKRYYIRHVNESEVNKIEELIINNLNRQFSIHMNNDFKELIKDVSLELYLEGLNFEKLNSLANEFNDFMDAMVNDLADFDFYSQVEKLTGLLELNVSSYAKALLIKNYTILLTEAYSSVNIFDSTYDKLNNELQKLKQFDVETIAFSIRYIDSLDGIIKDQLLIFFEELYNIIVSKIENSTNGIETIYDFMTVKDQMISYLFQLVPNFDDYENTINIFSGLYASLLPARIEEYNLVEAFRYKLHELYLDNHKLLSFCKYFNADEFNEFSNNIVNLYHSFGGEDFEKNITELYKYYEEGMYELLLLEIVKLGFTVDGEYDFEGYNKLRSGITKLIADLGNEDYQYLEKAFDVLFDELFKYLKEKHHLTIFINPLEKYLNSGGKYLEHFIEQFDLEQYISLEDGKTIEDLILIIKNWNEEDLEKIKNTSYDITEIQTLFTELGLDGIVKFNMDELFDLVSEDFINHLTNFLNEINGFTNNEEIIKVLFDHFEFETVIMPLLEQFVKNLDERYGLDIDYAAFIYNLLTNLGCDVPMVFLNISEIVSQFDSIKNDFELEYLPPVIDVVNKDSQFIVDTIEKNLIFFVFGDEMVVMYEAIDQFSDDIDFILNQLKNILPEDLYNEFVDKVTNLFNLDEQLLNKIQDLFNEEYINKIKEVLKSDDLGQILEWYDSNLEYQEQVNELLKDILNDLKNIFDEVISRDNILSPENVKFLEKIDQYLLAYDIQVKDSLEKIIDQYEKLKDYDINEIIDYLLSLL